MIEMDEVVVDSPVDTGGGEGIQLRNRRRRRQSSTRLRNRPANRPQQVPTELKNVNRKEVKALLHQSASHSGIGCNEVTQQLDQFLNGYQEQDG